MKDVDYTAVALKIVPIGSHPSLVELRRSIAEHMAWHVMRATTAQREQAYPELGEARKAFEAQLRELERQRKELQGREEALLKRERHHAGREKDLGDLVEAFTRWLGWMDGEGEVDENAKRFNAVRSAFTKYKGAKR